MAQETPIREECTEAYEIIEKILNLNPEIFGGITKNIIGAVLIVNKTRPESHALAGKRFTIKGITGAEAIFSSKQYVIEMYADFWTSCSPATKSVIMAEVLYFIPPDNPDGTLTKEDYHDRMVLIKSLGLSYRDNLSVPDLTVEKVLKPA